MSVLSGVFFPKQGEGAKNKRKKSKRGAARRGVGLLEDLDPEELAEVDRCVYHTLFISHPNILCSVPRVPICLTYRVFEDVFFFLASALAVVLPG